MFGSSATVCAGALFCWTKISPGAPGHLALMAGKTSSNTFSMYASLFTVTKVVIMVPAALFLLFRRASTSVVKGKVAMLPSKFWWSTVFLRGRATAAKNVTLHDVRFALHFVHRQVLTVSQVSYLVNGIIHIV